MTAEEVLDVLEEPVRQLFAGDRKTGPLYVVRAPEGLLIMQRGGGHILIQANAVELVVNG